MRRAFEAADLDFQLNVARTLDEARALLAQSTTDLIIADLQLPDGQSTELLDDGGEAIPLVVLTAQGDEDIAVAAIKSGALDYRVKSSETFSALPHIAERAMREWQHITARRQAENALRASEARYRAVTEGSLQGIAIIQDTVFIYANMALATIYGYPSPEALIGQSFLQHVAPHERPLLARSYAARQQGDTAPVREEYQAIKCNGTPVWIEQMMTPMAGEDPTAFLVTMLDITDRKQVEAIQRDLDAKLWQAKKMEAIGNLAGGIAHDFNNILGAIISFTELATLKVSRASQAWEPLQDVLLASQWAKTLIQQILTFSHNSDTERIPVCIVPLLEEVLTLLRATLPATIEISQCMPEEAGAVLANATELHQVLMN